MNKRFFLALVLTALVIVATPYLFPDAMRQKAAPAAGARDSTVGATAAAAARGAQAPTTADSTTRPPSAAAGNSSTTTNTAVKDASTSPGAATAETTTVRTTHATYGFTSRGAVPVSIVLDSFAALRPDARGKRVQLVASAAPMLGYTLVLGADTLALDTLSLAATQTNGAISYTGLAGGRTVRVSYNLAQPKEPYLTQVNVAVSGAPAGSGILIRLPSSLHSNEADTLDDVNHLAVSYRPARGDVKSVAFSKLDTAEVRAEAGPINWVATRDKYFLTVVRAGGTPFGSLRLQGMPRKGKVAEQIKADIALPLSADGTASFDLYAGPQQFERLQGLGGDLDQVNPYAGWLHGVVQPFATIVMKALLWMKRTTQLNYGWVLVLFGVLIRLILWPLNQGAMRTSMKMQRLQPELQDIQKRFKDDPKKQQEEIMKVYKSHDMSPLSPLMGCLPMLLPMPVLFALYYVFQNTIEFRGVPFLWLPDISLRDPYFITPLLMGVSMFVMSWIGMRNSPPNPQAKMMSYMMPVMLTVLFFNFASGLNMYYAVQNIAAIPQQWLLARERAKPGNAAPATTGSPGRRG